MWCKPSPFLYPLCSLFSADLYLKGLMILYLQDMLIRLLRVPKDPQNEGATVLTATRELQHCCGPIWRCAPLFSESSEVLQVTPPPVIMLCYPSNMV